MEFRRDFSRIFSDSPNHLVISEVALMKQKRGGVGEGKREGGGSGKRKKGWSLKRRREWEEEVWEGEEERERKVVKAGKREKGEGERTRLSPRSMGYRKWVSMG